MAKKEKVKLQKMYYDVAPTQELDLRASKVISLWLTGYYTKKQIGEITNLNGKDIDRILSANESKTLIEQELNSALDLVNKRIKVSTIKALDTMESLLDSSDDKIRFQVSKDLLDRGGFMAVQKKEVQVTQTFEQKLDQLLDDVDFVEVE